MTRTAHSIHRTGMARMRDVHLSAANDQHPAEQPTHSCPECGTGYFQPQSCDWCGLPTTPVSNPTER